MKSLQITDVSRLKARSLPLDTFRENVAVLARDNPVLRPERLAGARRLEVKARGVTILASPMIADDPSLLAPPRYQIEGIDDDQRTGVNMALWRFLEFLANAIPHFVSGVTGHPFQSPFASPPGQGLSSATVNVLWALANLVAGYYLFRTGKVSNQTPSVLIPFFAGILAMGTFSSLHFAKKAPTPQRG